MSLIAVHGDEMNRRLQSGKDIMYYIARSIGLSAVAFKRQ